MQVMGNDTGRPTVLLEAGIGSFSANWAWVQNSLASVTRVVASDRAGLGWSDPAAEPQDAQQSARDLHAALQAAGYTRTLRGCRALVRRPGRAGVSPTCTPRKWWAWSWSTPLTPTSGRTSRPPGAAARWHWATGSPASWPRLGILRLFNMNAPLTAGLPDRPAAELKAFLDRPGSMVDERRRPGDMGGEDATRDQPGQEPGGSAPGGAERDGAGRSTRKS